MISLQEEKFWLIASEVLVHAWLVSLTGAWTLPLKDTITIGQYSIGIGS